jgi:hypothetical protein
MYRKTKEEEEEEVESLLTQGATISNTKHGGGV